MNELNRRNLLIGAAGLSLASCSSSPKPVISEVDSQSELESANEKLVNDFCRDWATGDVNVLAEYFAEDITYQMVENVPLIHGKAEFKEKVAPFLSNFNEIRWDILRSSVMGPVVLNDRIDYYEQASKGKDLALKVVGAFVIENNKILEWRDWSTPVLANKKI